LFSREQEDALWQQVFTAQPERRREFEPVGRGASNQAAQGSTRALAARYGLNPKTVAKWRKRPTIADQPMGPRRPRSTVLSEVEEAIIVEFRRRTLLPLDDVLGCLRDAIPKLSRSALHRCLVRHGISRLPRDEEKASKRQHFAETAIGYVHIDVCELRLAEGKLFMFLAIDRVSKFVHVAFFEAATKMNGAAFLREVVATFPYAIHTVLTDNGMAFADLPKYRDGPTARRMGHIFDRVCREHGIEHKLTKPYHPWTNGQAERMNRTVKDATIKAFHYPDLAALRAHVLAFVAAYNFAKHLKALRWRTPFQAVLDAWTKDPSIFKMDPHHLIPGPNS
jgi:transposase InsO family protein